MPTLPLISSHGPDGLIARSGTHGIHPAAFLEAAGRLAARLPPDAQLLNLCEDRYHFAVGLAAGLISGRRTLLPPTQAPEVLRRLHELAAPLVCLTDGDAGPAVLAQLRCPVICVSAVAQASAVRCVAGRSTAPIPQIDAGQTAVIIFTSGSTGAPVAHAKSFGQLVAATRVQMTRLPPPLCDAGEGCAWLGTMPAQHMFGLESTVMLPMQSGGVLCAGRPFFPADIVTALRSLPRPRALVATPVHLRALLDAAVPLPALDLVLCATAALPGTLAYEVERRCAAPLIEIYGSTETGQIASRRTARQRAWQLWPQVRLRQLDGEWYAHGGHVSVPTLLADEFEPLDEAHFLLHGRTADLVNVAGKRSSLAHLSQQLLAIPGVQDGAFFLHAAARGSITGVTRLAAMAVAPGLRRAQILAALRERIDAVFLPRPLWLVERLPRNATGKLPQDALQGLAAQLTAERPGNIAVSRTQLPLHIPADHPALPGHFPGAAVIPGALLLDEVLHAIEQLRGRASPVQGWQIEVVKFHRPAGAQETMQLQIDEDLRDGQVRYAFKISAGEALIARGRVLARIAAAHARVPGELAAVPPSTPASPQPPALGRRTAVLADQGWRDRPERGNALLVRWMVAISLRLGRPVGRTMLYVIAAYYFCFAPRAAAAMRGYLRRALGRRPRPADRLRLILSFANTVHDRLWLLRRRDELFEISLEGEGVVRDAVSSGGAFLMGAHVGSFEVLRLIGRRQGFTVAISMYEAQARRLNGLLDAIAPDPSLQIIPVGRVDSMLRIHEALERGCLVGMLADRLFGAEPSLSVNFLGAPARFPVNPMRLAAMLRRRVVFMLGLYRGANRYHVVFEPLADFSRVTPGTRQAAIEAAVQRYAQLLERHCRTDPYNWFNFFDFWPGTQPPAAPVRAAGVNP